MWGENVGPGVFLNISRKAKLAVASKNTRWCKSIMLRLTAFPNREPYLPGPRILREASEPVELVVFFSIFEKFVGCPRSKQESWKDDLPDRHPGELACDDPEDR